MAASSTLTYELASPRRPSLDDVGGGAKENDLTFGAPDPVTDPLAEEWNQISKQVAALPRTAPMAVVEVRFSGGNPIIDRVSCTNANLTVGTFTPADNGAGDTSITWPANTFPAKVCADTAHVVEDVEIDRVRTMPIANGVRVKTKLGASGTDARFVVCIYGQ